MGYKDVKIPKGSRFLVTGGAGFIGSNLCEALISTGHEVRCLDDLSTGSLANLSSLVDEPTLAFMKGDIRDYDVCMNACAGVQFVLHQAAWGSVPRSIEMPLVYEEINIRGTLNMLEAARQSGVQKFVYASSSSVYGDHEALPKVEGQEGRPLSPYAATKRANEEYGILYHRLYGLDTYGLRYFNVFGRRQNPDGAYAAAIPRFVSRILDGEACTIYGDGSQTRDFTYIDNVIEANLRACVAPSAVAGQVFNIAAGGQERLLDVYWALCDALGRRIEPVFAPERPGEIKHSNASIAKARDLLGYDPEFSFADGMRLAIDWYAEKLSHA